MYNFLVSCGICSAQPRSGDHTYEAYPKIISTSSQQRITTKPIRSLIATDSTFQELLNDNPREVSIHKVFKSKYDDLLKNFEVTGGNFLDREFPPQQSSVGEVEDLRVRATWKRIPDVVIDPVFCQGAIDPLSIFQGSRGDGYFLSAVSALAEKDERLKNLFPELRMNRYGLYMARLMYGGVVQEVVVDDYIPVDQQGQPLFAKPAKGREIWIMILEKCWAKLHKSYGAVVGGLPGEVLSSLTRAPNLSIVVPQSSDQGLWHQLSQSLQKGAVCCCSSKGDQWVEQQGLARGHAFTLLEAYSLPYRLLKLRGPWGNQWRGRAGNGDWQFWSSIPPVDRQKMGYEQSSQKGIFFMLWEDFSKFFDLIDLCLISDNASSSYCSQKFSRKTASMFEFQTSGGETTLSLTQASQRGLKKKVFSRMVILLGRKEEKADGIDYRFVDCGTENKSHEQHMRLGFLPQGKYVVYTKIRWLNQQEEEQACLRVYSSVPVNLTPTKQCSHKKFIYQIFLDHARNNPKKQQLGHNEWLCNDMLLSECGYGYLAFHLDEKSDRKLGVEIAESEYIERRLMLKKPYRGRGSIKLSVEPGKEVIVLFLMKSQNLPTQVTLPVPKIYNLI